MTPRVAFVNGGILGLTSYASWVRRAFADDTELHAEHFVLSENLPIRERIVRRASFAATATSQPRIWVGSLTSPIRRHAMAHAA